MLRSLLDSIRWSKAVCCGRRSSSCCSRSSSSSCIGLVGTMFMVWYERKVVSGMQNRVGPNKAGPFGHPADARRRHEADLQGGPAARAADRIVFRIAPFLAFVPAFLVWSVIPLGGDFSDGKDGTVEWFGHVTLVQLADPPMGILVVLALSSIAVYGIMLAGWSSGSKYPLLGSVRASAQMISLRGGARAQRGRRAARRRARCRRRASCAARTTSPTGTSCPTGIVPFVIFVIAATAELNRPPFDLVEAEQELVGGFNTEYSAFSFALFFLAEFMNVITMSLVIVTLFLGGPQPVEIGGIEPARVPRAAQRHRLAGAQAVRVPVHVRVVPGHAAPPALRPTDGLRLEGAHPDLARMVPAARRAP